MCIHQLFEAQVEQTPGNIAVTFEQQHVTYHELNCRANQLARYLNSLGVRSETRVGICVERSVEMIIGMLGILKAGGTYVPIEPDYPQERQTFILADSGVTVLLTQSHLIEKLPVSQVQIVCLDLHWEYIAREKRENRTIETAGEHLAYVIYTSGSTGRPKGVAISHHSVTHLIVTSNAAFHFDKYDTWTVFHSYAFDLSVWEIWTPLLCGCREVIVPLNLTRSPEQFAALLRREQITVLNQTPSAMRLFIDAQTEIPFEDIRHELVLRLIICGGEALSQKLAQKLLTWNIPLWNFYGPTEATVWAANYHVDVCAASDDTVPIGKALEDTRLYVLDPSLQPLPVGLTGELYIGGVGLARGYFNHPELTAEKFIPNPFFSETDTNASLPEPGTRLYKTGDLARYRPDGNIEFLGRIDAQVKIRGFRVELEEIESVFRQHRAIEDIVVTVLAEESGENSLNAYWISNQTVVPDSAELRSFAKTKLPEHMLPSAFVRLDAFPLSSNGKINRRALPVPLTTRPKLPVMYQEPRNPIEKNLVDIWADVLGIEQIGCYDNFFELGGNSLVTMQILSRINAAFHINLQIHVLFDNLTVESLGRHIETLLWAAQEQSHHETQEDEDREVIVL